MPAESRSIHSPRSRLRQLTTFLLFAGVFFALRAEALDTTPPTIPAGLGATALTTSRVQLKWNVSTDIESGVAGYRVYRNGALIGSSAVSAYDDTGLAANTAYVYTVTAYDLAAPPNESTPSAPANATTLSTAPGQVYQCNDAGASGRLVVDINSLALPVTLPNCSNLVVVPLANATMTLQRWHPDDLNDPYAIWQPIGSLPGGWSLFTPNGWQTLAQLQGGGGVVDTTPPTVPAGLNAIAASSSAINLSWSGSTDTGGTGVGGYRIRRGGVLIGTTSGTTYPDSGLTASTLYSYTVSAYDLASPANESAPSGVASATTQAAPSSGQVYQCNDGGASGRQVVDTNSLGLPVVKPNCANMVAVSLASATITLQRWHPNDLADPFAIWQSIGSLPAGWSLWTPSGWQTVAQLQGGGGVVDTTPPTVPAGLNATAASSSAINLSWSASTDTGGTGVAGYRIRRGGVVIGTTSGTTYPDSGLTASTLYSYTVSAYDLASPANESAPSGASSATTLAVPDTTPPTVPAGLNATAASSSAINLSWSASTDTGGTGVAGYRIRRGGVVIGTTSGTTYPDSGLTASTLYSYTVSAYDLASPANESVPSGSASATTLSGVSSGQVYQCNDAGASGRLAVDTNSLGLPVTMPNCANMVALSLGSATLVLQRWHPGDLADPFAIWQPVGSLPPGWFLWTPNGWQTLAQLQGGGGAVDTTPPTVPSGLGATAVSSSAINLSWTGSTDAGGTGVGGYRVYRGGGLIATVGGTTYGDTGLNASTLYNYTVSAIDLASPVNESAQSGAASATTQAGSSSGQVYQCNDAGANGRMVIVPNSVGLTPNLPNCSNMVAVSLASATITLQRWNPNVLSDPDAIWQPLSSLPSWWSVWTPNGWQTLAQVQGTPVNDTTPPTIPNGLQALALGGTSIQLSWNNSSDSGTAVGGYRIYRNGSPLLLVIHNSYTDTGLTPNTLYTYTVSAIDLASPSNESTQSGSASATTSVTDTTAPSVPTGLNANATAGGPVQLNWNASTDPGPNASGVAGYRIRRGGSPIGTTTSTGFTDGGVAPNTFYSYTVTAFDAASPSNESNQSGSASTTTTNFSVSSSNWAWMAGSQNLFVAGSYGSQGNAGGGNSPGGRVEPATWTDGGFLWLYGGFGADGAGAFGRLADLWKFDTGSGQWTWVSGSQFKDVNPNYGTQGQTNGSNNPGSRSGPITWKDSSGNFWMFGGVTVSPGYDSKNDLWKYQPSSNQWTWIAGTQTTNAGGVCGQQGVAASGNVPGARKSAASWIDSSGNLWLFGGVGQDCNGGVGHLNDLWKYSMSSGQWAWMGGPATAGGPGAYGTQGTGATGNYPSSRQQMGAWTDSSGNFWLFGGFGQDYGPNAAEGNCCGYGEFNDLWKYTPSNGQWTWVGGSNIGEAHGVYGTQGVASSNNMPGARNNVQTGLDSSGNFWLFGGFGHDVNGSRELLNDVWKYNPSSNLWTWVAGPSFTHQAASWGTQGVASPGNTPGARQQFVSWVDSSGHLWIFGGEGLDGAGVYGQLNDLWKY